MMKRVAYGLLLAAAVLVPLVAIAEGPSGPGKDPDSKGRLFLTLRIADELDLTDEKALAVGRALKQVEDRRDELRDKRRELDKQIHDALAQKKPDDAVLSKLIDQTVELDRQRAKAMEDSFTSLKKILTVQEQAKLVLLRGRMHHEGGPRGPGGWQHGGGWHHERGGGHGPDHDADDRPGPPQAENDEG